MRKGIAVAVLVAILALAGGYVYRYQLQELFTGGEAEAFRQAKKLIDEGNPTSALNWLRPFSRELHETGAHAAEWRKLYITAAMDAKDGGALLQLYESNPRIFEENEEATLLVADRLIKLNRSSDYTTLRDRWQGREVKSDVWFNFDADQMILDGDRTGAIAFLGSQSFEGKADTGRLVRLALLTIKDKPREAWEYLAQAYAKDPDNPEIRSYRARLMEVVGQTGLALNEYLAAAESAPDQVFYQDQLAEFYRRNHRYDLAVDVWKAQLERSNSDTIWLKAWFWTRVVAPLGIHWKDQPVLKGSWEPFLNYLAHLKPGTFWDAEAFEEIPNAHTYLQTQQVTFWLRLMDALQKHNEDLAWELLQYNLFASQSWNPSLENLLRKVLTYRKIGTFNIDVIAAEPSDTTEVISQAKGDKKPTHPLFAEVNALSVKGADALKISDTLRELLTSSFSIPSCFLVAGWLEAALDLTAQPILIPEGMPEWLGYGYAQAIRAVKGVEPALEFVKKQPATPSLSLMLGELLVADKQLDSGAEQLQKLSGLDSDVGFRAAWLLSLLYADGKQFDQARAVIAGQPRLAKDILGLETLARISLLEGNIADADKQYLEIQDKSWEAKSYLARKAFSDKEYQKAHQLTRELLQQFPNNVVLRQNYERIQKELKNGDKGDAEKESN